MSDTCGVWLKFIDSFIIHYTKNGSDIVFDLSIFACINAIRIHKNVVQNASTLCAYEYAYQLTINKWIKIYTCVEPPNCKFTVKR